LITPVLVANIGWGTFLFFAILNATFLPVIYFFYPETARRSLEEIDIIFAKGNVEKISYVKAAKELPLLSDEEVEQEALKYGLIDTAARGVAKMAGNRNNEKGQYENSSKKSDEDLGSKQSQENALV
jgi:hypothetical protein